MALASFAMFMFLSTNTNPNPIYHILTLVGTHVDGPSSTTLIEYKYIQYLS
jgi:hypothetical protein